MSLQRNGRLLNGASRCARAITTRGWIDFVYPSSLSSSLSSSSSSSSSTSSFSTTTTTTSRKNRINRNTTRSSSMMNTRYHHHRHHHHHHHQQHYQQFRSFRTSSSHATTVLGIRKDSKTVLIADGQVTMGSEIIKHNVIKVRKLGEGVISGFAGSTADAFTLFERLEQKIEEHPGQLTRACV